MSLPELVIGEWVLVGEEEAGRVGFTREGRMVQEMGVLIRIRDDGSLEYGEVVEMTIHRLIYNMA